MAISLKAARINAGLNGKEAAKALGISRATLSSWENAKTVPSIPMIPIIERVYKVKYDDLIFLPTKSA